MDHKLWWFVRKSKNPDQLFILIGIPYFAFMMSVISELINSKFDKLRKRLVHMPACTIPIGYTLIGFIFLVIVPSFIFSWIEGTLV